MALHSSTSSWCFSVLQPTSCRPFKNFGKSLSSTWCVSLTTTQLSFSGPVLGSSVPPALLGGVHLPAGLQAPAREWQPLERPQVLPSDSGQPVPGFVTGPSEGGRVLGAPQPGAAAQRHWTSHSVGGPPRIETQTTRNLWEAGVRMPRQRKELGDIRLEPKGLGHLSTVAPSDWLMWGPVPLPAEGSASGPARAAVHSRSL